jgi:hypothetical protein
VSSAEALIAEIEQAGEAFASFVAGQPLAAFHRRPAPQEWSAAELSGHVAEFPATFSLQAKRLAEQPGLSLGRELDDPGRLAAVDKLAGAGPAEAAAMVRDTVRQATATLRQIPDSGWQVEGTHIRYGTFTARQIVERFVLEHLRTHLEQARAAVASAARSD